MWFERCFMFHPKARYWFHSKFISWFPQGFRLGLWSDQDMSGVTIRQMLGAAGRQNMKHPTLIITGLKTKQIIGCCTMRRQRRKTVTGCYLYSTCLQGFANVQRRHGLRNRFSKLCLQWTSENLSAVKWNEMNRLFPLRLCIPLAQRLERHTLANESEYLAYLARKE